MYPCPLLRQGLATRGLQRGAVGGDRLPQQFQPRLPLAADGLLLEGESQIVLRLPQSLLLPAVLAQEEPAPQNDKGGKRDAGEDGQGPQAAQLALLAVHAGAPLPAQLFQHGAQAVDAVLCLGQGAAEVVEGGVGLDSLAVGGLEGPLLRRLGLGGICIRGMRGIEQDVADGLALAAGVEGLELGVAALPDLRVRRRRGEALALADELDDAVTGIHMPHEHVGDVAVLHAEDFLEVRVVALMVQQPGDDAAQGAVLRADGGDEEERAITHVGGRA